MSKANYTKVEELLAAAQLKMMCDYLLGITPGSKPSEKEESFDPRQVDELHQELKKLLKKDKALWEHLGLDKAEIKKYLKHPTELTPEERKKIKAIRQQIQTYKKQIEKVEKDEDIVELERKKHKNKRFNVREGWLPLK